MAARRGRGEGSITKRSDGRWMARVDLGWQDGKRGRKAVYGRTRREVQEKLNETLHRTTHGLPPVPDQETVGSFLRRWLDVRQGKVRARTHERYTQVVHAHLLPHLDRVRLAKLTPADVAACLQRVEAAGSAYTACGAREVLRCALNQGVRWELVPRNVAEEGTTTEGDGATEDRERLELRSRASLGRFLVAALRGRSVDGAEAELQAEAGVDGIPLELWDVPAETRADAPTGAPGTVGVNLDRIRPAVFAHAVLPRLGVEMPRVASGTYASATVTTSLTAGSHAKGSAAGAPPRPRSRSRA